MSRRMAGSSDRRRAAFGPADQPSSELWTMVHRAELRLSRYSRPPKDGTDHGHAMEVGHGRSAAHFWSRPHETDSTSHGRCRGNPARGRRGEVVSVWIERNSSPSRLRLVMSVAHPCSGWRFRGVLMDKAAGDRVRPTWSAAMAIACWSSRCYERAPDRPRPAERQPRTTWSRTKLAAIPLRTQGAVQPAPSSRPRRVGVTARADFESGAYYLPSPRSGPRAGIAVRWYAGCRSEAYPR
jgi:hypothetical protein